MDHRVFLSHSSADHAIAEAICNKLEGNGIRCWIAPRDIHTTDWADSIMKGLQQCDVFVVVISRNSINSAEVTKEVTEATHVCRYILPFKVDPEDLSDRLRYHLGPCHWLDAVTPPLDARITELLQRIDRLSPNDAVYANQNRRTLVERIIWPRNLFVGRDEEIAQIADALDEDHVLFLQGMGGIGKSEIAKAYAKTYRDRYDTIVFAGYTGSIQELVISDAIPITNLQRGSADTESPEEFFARKLQVLKSISTERTLLIIDNFDTTGDPDLEELVSGPYHIIFTTRYEFEEYPRLRIGKIQDFTLVRQLFTTCYGRPLPDAEMEVVDRILRLVDCHTITVELIAKQMKASRRKPAQMLEMLQKTGTNTSLKEKIKHSNTDTGLTSFDFIRQMFHISGLSETEEHILCCMCMVPYTGIDFATFAQWCDLESYDDINSLLAKSWLQLDEDTDILSLHPVICDVVKADLNPTTHSCADFIKGIWKASKDAWWMTVEQRSQIMPYVAHIQNHYPQPIPELFLQYADFVNIAWICSDFDRSQRSGHVFYEFCLAQYGPDSEECGDAARYLAGAYHNGGDNVSAEPYYRLALEHYLASIGPDAHKVAVTCSKLGRCAYYNGDFAGALEYLNRAMAIFQKFIDNAADPAEKNLRTFQTGDNTVEFERLYMAQGDYTTALEYAKRSYDLFLLKEGKEIANSAYSLVDMGICYTNLGQYPEAEHYLNRALQINITFNGQASVQTVRTREAIADNDLARGNLAEARSKYLQLELDLEKDFGPANPQVLAIKAKREQAEAMTV